MVGRSSRRIFTQSSFVNLREEDDFVELEEKEVREVPVQPTSSRRTSKKTRTSLVWQAFEIITIIEDGKDVPKAKCKYCGNIYVVESAGGTGRLIRHRKKCGPKHIAGNQGEVGSMTHT